MSKEKKAGRPKFKVTPEMRKQVESLSGMGLPQEQIGSLIGCSDDTLRKNFEEELTKGKAKANAKIAQSLFNKAIGGETTALIFWAKTQMKWSEKQSIELTGANGGAIDINISSIEATDRLLANLRKD